MIREHAGGNRRIAIDRVGPVGMIEMQRLGYEIVDGFEVMENARSIKSAGEITLMRHSIAVCEQAIAQMREALTPGITENALWAELHRGNIAGGGEWIECRLLASGPRTNPWFRESSMRVIERGDIVAFDTDLVGPYGYCCDISRTWVCDARPSDEQRRIYAEAYAQVQENKALLKPGATFRELTEFSRPFSDEFVRGPLFGVDARGGALRRIPQLSSTRKTMSPETTACWRRGMVICVEGLAAPAGGREAVKLEEQVLITANGHKQLSSYPLEEDWL